MYVCTPINNAQTACLDNFLNTQQLLVCSYLNKLRGILVNNAQLPSESFLCIKSLFEEKKAVFGGDSPN